MAAYVLFIHEFMKCSETSDAATTSVMKEVI
jgi:hypothetical protein